MRNTRRTIFLILTVLMAVLAGFQVSAAGISAKKLTLITGKTQTLKVSGAKKVKWSSSDKKVASVSSKGVVKGIRDGKANIIAKVGKKKYTCRVTVVRARTTGAAAPAKHVSSGSTCTMSAEEKKVYNILIAFRTRYPEGKPWGEHVFYAWNGGTFAGGYGCAAFAFKLSDAAFKSKPARIHGNKNNIKVGDILRVDGNTHSVIVLKKTSAGVVVAEGNFIGAVHWGRTISWKELGKKLDYVLTRY